jgi:hypothetical protein
VLTWKEDDYRERKLSKNDNYKSKLLPGLEVPLREVFAN